MKRYIFPLILLYITLAQSQNNPIKIVDQEIRNRLALYAVNQSETDYDVLLTVSGTGFKQRKGKPRWMFVPSASKVLINTLIIERGKKVNYSYDLQINDSLSNRSIRKPSESIKIKPKKQIAIYKTSSCKSCDTLIGMLKNSKYIFDSYALTENSAIQEQISRILLNSGVRLDTVSSPIIILGGKLYTEIEDYDDLFAKMHVENTDSPTPKN